jgi:hypothetical protein
MRYFITGEWNRHSLLRILMSLFFLYVVGLLVTNTLMYFLHMDLNPASVVEYYRGNESKFLPPKSYEGLLEVTHMHFFAMSILFVTLTHLLLFVELPSVIKISLACLLFASGLGDIGAGWLVRYLHPHFALLKIASFLGLQISMVIILWFTIGSLVRGNKLSFRDPKSRGKKTSIAA